MKRNLSKAILATVTALVGTQSALAQYDPNCWPTGSNPVGHSTDYGILELSTILFGAAVGISGTDTYVAVNNEGGDPQCGNEVLTMGGRFGFEVGATGSIQSTIDDALSLTFGMPQAVGNSCGFAMVVTGNLPTINKTLFGPPTTAEFYGTSNRYFIAESTVSGIDTTLRVDVVADAARFQWTLLNTSATATVPVGLMAGSWVQPAQLQPYDQHITYVYSPGYKPFITEHLFQASDTINPLPGALMFAISQANAYGLQIINTPLVAPNQYGISAPDQTPVDDLVIGNGSDVLNANTFPTAATTPAPPWPPIIDNDLSFVEVPSDAGGISANRTIDDAAFLQFWEPQAVAPGQSRTIISYYRSTWGVSDYSSPFAAVVDTPLAITTNAQNPSTFANGTFDFRVYIDNVLAYANAGSAIKLSNVRIQVNLPQGMVDATNPTGSNASTLVAYIANVDPIQVAFQDFQVQVNPNVSPGPQSYSVQITTGTGASKTLYGTINVAGTPNLNIRQSANLIGVPWIFSTSDWGTVLGLTANTDFQAFSWDPVLGQYTVSPNAQRGQGVFIVSQADHGTIALGGNPQQDPGTVPSALVPQPPIAEASPEGLKGGSTDIINGQASGQIVTLNPGWNLISNPFNYVISLGQLLGIDKQNPTNVLSFTDMTETGLISPSFAYYDPDSQGYNYISAVTDLMLPSQGYWVFCATQDSVEIVFPTVLSPFVKSAAAPWKQTESQWRLQLVAQNGKSVDAQNYIGVAPTTVSKLMTTRKPPTAPVANAVSLNVQDTVNGKVVPLSQSLRSTGGNTQTWNVQVTSKAAGPVTINWPNLSTLPKDVQFQLTDVSSGATRDIRRGSAYTFNATAGATRAFTISAVPGAGSRPIITNVTASYNRAIGGGVSIAYVLASSSTVSVRVLQNGRAIYQVLSGRAVSAGTNTANWALRDSANRTVAPGLYTIEITAEGADGERVHRTIPVTITR